MHSRRGFLLKCRAYGSECTTKMRCVESAVLLTYGCVAVVRTSKEYVRRDYVIPHIRCKSASWNQGGV